MKLPLCTYELLNWDTLYVIQSNEKRKICSHCTFGIIAPVDPTPAPFTLKDVSGVKEKSFMVSPSSSGVFAAATVRPSADGASFFCCCGLTGAGVFPFGGCGRASAGALFGDNATSPCRCFALAVLAFVGASARTCCRSSIPPGFFASMVAPSLMIARGGICLFASAKKAEAGVNS